MVSHAMDWVTITTDSEDETQALGARIAAVLPLGRVVALHGDLGAGKTVLSRGLARGVGITEPVTSPTFTVVQEYERPGGSWLFHLDMYRIECDDDALAFGIEEFLFAPDAVAVVEWPERIAGLLECPSGGEQPDRVAGRSCVPDLVVVRLSHVAESRREIQLPGVIHDLCGF